MAQQAHSHLIVTDMGDPIQSHRSIADLQISKVDFQWKQTLIDILVEIPAPPMKNTYQDLINEWRLVYENNAEQTKAIDEFEATYDPSMALQWYTRGTFFFKMVNMALRTENIVVIWRLRFYIQDLHEQLKQLHQGQRATSIGMYANITVD